jgi:hypothetical protein
MAPSGSFRSFTGKAEFAQKGRHRVTTMSFSASVAFFSSLSMAVVEEVTSSYSLSRP